MHFRKTFLCPGLLLTTVLLTIVLLTIGGCAPKPTIIADTNQSTANENRDDDPLPETNDQQENQSGDESGDDELNLTQPWHQDGYEEKSETAGEDIQPIIHEEPFEPDYPVDPAIDIPDHWIRLHRKHEIWVDMQEKQVIVGGNVCMQEGPLEVFACCMGQKLHESVVDVHAKSSEVHAALLAVGAKAGHPVQYAPEYQVATGTEIEITVAWKNADDEMVEVRAQQLVRDSESKEPLTQTWVFAGSTLIQTPGEKPLYAGDYGEFICLSNFTSATLDLPIESSRNDADRLFEANPESVPAVKTRVYLFLKPMVKEAVEPGADTETSD